MIELHKTYYTSVGGNADSLTPFAQIGADRYCVNWGGNITSIERWVLETDFFETPEQAIRAEAESLAAEHEFALDEMSRQRKAGTQARQNNHVNNGDPNMDFNNMFPSKFFKAADFPQPRVLTTKSITMEEVGDDQKYVVWFNEDPHGWVLNKTNGSLLARSLGGNTDGWLDKPVELRNEPVPFAGKIVDSIRVRVVNDAPPQPAFEDRDIGF